MISLIPKFLIWVVLSLSLTTTASFAVVAKIAGAEMAAKVNKKDEVAIKGWKIRGNKKAIKLWKVREVNGKEYSAVALVKGVVLESKVSLPELIEKEKKLKGEWTGMVSVDAYSVKRSGDLLIELVNDQGKVIFSNTWKEGDRAILPIIKIKGEVEKGIRLWTELDVDVVKLLMAKDVVMRVSVAPE